MSLHRSSLKIAAAVAVATLGISPVSFALDNVWTGATSNAWNDATNWSLGRVPTNQNGATTGDTFDDAVINSTTVVPLIDADLAATPRDILVGVGSGSMGQLNQTAGTAQTGGGNWMYVGRDGGMGTYNLGDVNGSGGTISGLGTGSGSMNVGGRLYVAGHVGGPAFGTVNINTTGQLTTGSDLNIGAANGSGTVNLDNGTVNVGGWISVGRDENGNSGSGTWNQSGGTVTVNGNTAIALPGTSGNFNMTGGAFTSKGEFWVGTGVGNGVPSYAIANVSGGTVTTNNWLAVGRNGAMGTLTVSGDGVVQKQGSGHITIGTGDGGNGTVNVQDNGTLSSNADLIVAENNATAVAVVNQMGGRVLLGGNLDVQRNGTGTYNLSGGTLSVDGRVPDPVNEKGQVLGIDAREGTFNFTGGRITRSNAGVITYVGDLHVGDKSAGFKLDNDKTFSVSGVLDIMSGVTLDVTGTTLPTSGGAGSFAMGTDGSINGTFDPSTTTLVGLGNADDATFISEAAGEGGMFNPSTDKVYWLQEQGGNVSLQYSLGAAVPEPTSLGLIGLGAVALVGRRRRR